jgi:hypothetical protein
MAKTWSEILRTEADQSCIPLRTLDQVRKGLEQCKKQKSDKTMARLMLNHGRLTDEARAFVAREYPQC